MYWWNERRLAEDLREGRFEKKEWWKYLLANVVLLSLFVLLIIYSSGSSLEAKLDAALAWVIYPTIAIFGIIFCYEANEEGDNADFILRMICLALPVAN